MNEKIMVTKSSIPDLSEYVEAIRPIWESRWLTNSGTLHQQLEFELKEFLGTPCLELYTNGHMALDVAIKAFQISGEAITTPFTFASTAHALAMNGVKPVFCDIKLTDYTLDETKVEALITEKTTAIVPVHVYGMPCNHKALAKIAEKYHLKLIYDAAHAFGVTVGGESVACWGDASMYSFHATKVFNTIEGGALSFVDNKMKKPLQNLKNFGIESAESVTAIGLNAKMNEFCAAMGICNLRHLSDNIASRKKAAGRYVERLGAIPGIKLIDFEECNQRGVQGNFAYFPIVVDETVTGCTRDYIFEKLQESNIYTRKYFYPLIPDFECYRENYKDIKIDNARYIAQRVLTLPIYADLSIYTVDFICDKFLEVLKGRRHDEKV